MFEALRQVLASEPCVQYALVFGSVSRGQTHEGSDLDLAIGTSLVPTHRDVGRIVGRLESATGRTVDLVVVREAPAPLAYRIFRDGIIVFERDRDAFTRDQAEAVLAYLDWKPFEEILQRGVLGGAKPRG